MRKATRRLRGSFSPSITWMKPKVKSAPRPFSSREERTRSLLSHKIESGAFFWPAFSSHCLLFLRPRADHFCFPIPREFSVKRRCVTIYNGYGGRSLTLPAQTPPFLSFAGEWVTPSFPLSSSQSTGSLYLSGLNSVLVKGEEKLHSLFRSPESLPLPSSRVRMKLVMIL